MIERKKCTMEHYDRRTIIKDLVNNHDVLDKEKPTAEELLEYIIGDRDDWYNSPYYIGRYNDRSKKTLVNRLNLLWFMPLFFVVILPIQYICTGTVGFRRGTRSGTIVQRIVGRFD